ncbi:hypothetical protein Pan97_30150 [Bremerella volcania]|uniref:5-bromo-4-chloroindolyl phosphate hydrolysis protein n=1 Tax=Bremerella volcania TaxID=2527984 RepID=A0A518C9T2_9BACT|nr:hypothetical protein [Bremerella volcania]QDU75971.1 hypothetical protein Pan97_30150 [Bremerella volcania]
MSIFAQLRKHWFSVLMLSLLAVGVVALVVKDNPWILVKINYLGFWTLYWLVLNWQFLLTLLVTLIAAAAAWYGPRSSVRIAHEMMEKENRRRDTSALFREIVRDAKRFCDVVRQGLLNQKLEDMATERLNESESVEEFNIEKKSHDERSRILEASENLRMELDGTIQTHIFALQEAYPDKCESAISHLADLIIIAEEWEEEGDTEEMSRFSARLQRKYNELFIDLRSLSESIQGRA